MQIRSLVWEDPLEEEMATHSSILAWEIPWTDEPGGLQSMGHKELDMTEHAHTVYGSRVMHEFLHERIYTQAPALGPGSHVLAHLCALAIVWQSAMYRHRLSAPSFTGIPLSPAVLDIFYLCPAILMHAQI